MTKLTNALVQRGLTSREAEVSSLVAQAMSNKEIGNQLLILEKTVKFHLTNIYKKMNVKSRAQLVVACFPYMNFGGTDETNIKS